VAHDFNNLLGVVLGNAELAISSLPPHSSVTEMLEDIAEAADSATGLCNQMLAFAGRNAVSAEPVECNAMIRDLSKLMQVSLSKKAALRLELAGNLGVTADRSQLRQVFMNLITNAAESIGNFEGEVVVKTEALRLTAEDITNRRLPERFQPGEFVEVSVRDSGCGMDAATRARVFDPFFTTKLDGRGLGLAAVKGIADAHGWMLQVNSSPGTGSTFTLLMPRADVPYTCGDEGHRDDGAEVVARVLVVDDEPGVLSIVTKFLERAGMDVLQATNGVEAIEIFRDLHDSIDCVVLDLNMPKLDGEEVFRELKAIREDVPVLLSSGFAEQEVLDRFRGAGLFGVVQKPVRMATLLEKVKLAVRRG
ncbi:MAG: response regulator, partial [Planctomycetes bacterium]|nr:response regulator [Planctomycetota bacterium]